MQQEHIGGNFDSLGLVEVQMELEDKYDFNFPKNYELPGNIGQLIDDVLKYRPR